MERILYGTDFIFTSSVEGGDKYLKQLSLAGSSEHVQLFTAFIKLLQSYSTFSFSFLNYSHLQVQTTSLKPIFI